MALDFDTLTPRQHLALTALSPLGSSAHDAIYELSSIAGTGLRDVVSEYCTRYPTLRPTLGFVGHPKLPVSMEKVVAARRQLAAFFLVARSMMVEAEWDTDAYASIIATGFGTTTAPFPEGLAAQLASDIPIPVESWGQWAQRLLDPRYPTGWGDKPQSVRLSEFAVLGEKMEMLADREIYSQIEKDVYSLHSGEEEGGGPPNKGGPPRDDDEPGLDEPQKLVANLQKLVALGGPQVIAGLDSSGGDIMTPDLYTGGRLRDWFRKKISKWFGHPKRGGKGRFLLRLLGKAVKFGSNFIPGGGVIRAGLNLAGVGGPIESIAQIPVAERRDFGAGQDAILDYLAHVAPHARVRRPIDMVERNGVWQPAPQRVGRQA